MSTTILTSLSTYMSKTSSMTTSKLKFVILKRLNKWKIKKKFRGGSCPGGKCTKVGGGRCHKNRGGRCHKNGGGKCPGGKCNTTLSLVALKCYHIALTWLSTQARKISSLGSLTWTWTTSNCPKIRSKHFERAKPAKTFYGHLIKDKRKTSSNYLFVWYLAND